MLFPFLITTCVTITLYLIAALTSIALNNKGRKMLQPLQPIQEETPFLLYLVNKLSAAKTSIITTLNQKNPAVKENEYANNELWRSPINRLDVFFWNIILSYVLIKNVSVKYIKTHYGYNH